MDFEFAIWQMLYLFYKPQNVYRNFQYRKVEFENNIRQRQSRIKSTLSKSIFQETKAQFARDDPAFLVLLAALLLVSTVILNNSKLSF